jgi:hypothetical protein
MTPSARALEIAELAAPDACEQSKRLIAAQIDMHADEARLEGVGFGLDAAAIKMRGIGGLGWSAESNLRALDPQQVINEGVK